MTPDTSDASDTPDTSDAPDTSDPTASDTATQRESEPTDDTTPTTDGDRPTGTDATHRTHLADADPSDATTHSSDDTPTDGVDTNTSTDDGTTPDDETATDDTTTNTDDTAARRWTLELPADTPADTDERHPSESDEGTDTPNTTADATQQPTATTTAEHPTDTSDDDTPPLLVAYRHDTHKLRGRSHEAAADRYAGVPVNQPVPRGADGDAALLSRPRGDPEPTVANHQSPLRLSLLTGDPAADATILNDGLTGDDFEMAVRDLVTVDDPVEAHRAWLTADAPELINESVYQPYTSAKYHTLLTAALLANYRAGACFADLALAVDEPDADPVPHRTVLQTERITLTVTSEPGDRPAAPLGPAPARSWADVWSRLSAHPDVVGASRGGRILDAQLRRIRSWSVALQFIKDYTRTATHLSGGLR